MITRLAAAQQQTPDFTRERVWGAIIFGGVALLSIAVALVLDAIEKRQRPPFMGCGDPGCTECRGAS